MAFNMTSYKFCCFFRLRFKSVVTGPPSDVEEFFDRYSHDGFMSIDQLQEFLVEVQKEEGLTTAKVEDLVTRHLGGIRILNKIKQEGLTLDTFFQFLSAGDNSPLRQEVHQDMSAPLSHYYIYTGHNSYLKGNQLNSNSSEIPIIKALKRGVRVIELDLWPHSRKDKVIVKHGGTMTRPVGLAKCLFSIKEYAFSASNYPVIITLEDHLTPKLRSKVAQMVYWIFGRMLFYPMSGKLEEYPSPKDLMNRILLSTKPPKEYLETEIQAKVRQNEKQDAWGNEISNIKAGHKTDTENVLEPSHPPPSDSYNSEDEDARVDDDGIVQEKMGEDAVPEFGKLITIRAGKPKEDLKYALELEEKHARRVSLSEPQLEDIAESHPAVVVSFTKRNILRIYPKGLRVDSSNFNPLIGWNLGAQMVAFNMQGYGRSLWLMQGFFRANGGCGYVKKPDFLLNDSAGDKVFNTSQEQQVKKTLKMKVYMGDGWRFEFRKTHFDICSPPDFSVKVAVKGVQADSTSSQSTETINDCWTPAWNKEFTFPLTVPEVALLRIEVHESDTLQKDDFAGQTCLPVWELKSGIRAVPLYDKRGDPYRHVKLLVMFQFE
ncbi:phosphoinositide phospholipase C 2 isoform X2 [Amborella trichopoda]|uniref:phosphoinositide phospholipase C 2 isoform X2 n=1 Tax=Amborella trichopoda TaxID=13333 RepID=UPI0009BF0F23|nr:phosphoinositide phospholipase C 2 isoform X2 [Amborella trichopoda]|eukprot:XP_011623006.2 phosphoinositide phospholipase C 2 isoform X2 [Amborella trichopoda]